MRPPIHPRPEERDTDHLLAIFFDQHERINRGGKFIRALTPIQWPHRRHPHIYIEPGGRKW